MIGRLLSKQKEIFVVMMLILSLFTIVFQAGAGGSEGSTSMDVSNVESASRASAPVNARAEWNGRVIASTDNNIEMITAGNFLDTNAGMELVIAVSDVTAGSTDFQMIDGSGSSWSTQDIFQSDTAITGMDWLAPVGEASSEGIVFATNSEGNGTVTLITKPTSGTTWTAKTIDEYEQSIKVMVTGDLLSDDPGMDIITADQSKRIQITSMTELGDWATNQFVQMDDHIVDMVVADVETDVTGNQLYTVDDSGNLHQVTGSGSIKLWTEPSGTGLSAVAVGDPDSDNKMEILVAVSDNSLKILDRSGDGSWSAKNIFIDQEKITDIVITDIDPFRDGLEVAVSGESKKLTLLTHTAGSWSSRTLYESDDTINALYAGNVDDDSISATEIVAVNGEGGEVALVEFSGYYSEVLYKGVNKLSGVGFGDLDPANPGNEAFVVGMDGDDRGVVAMAWRSGDSWVSKEIFNGASPYTTGELLTPVIGDFDNDAGNEFAVVGMYQGKEGVGPGQVTMIKKEGTNFVPEQIVFYPSFLHGAAIGDFLSENDGNELIVTSFTDKGVGNVSVISKNTLAEGGGWNTTLVWQTTGSVRKAMFADLDPGHAGDELFVVDKTGNLTMLYQDATGFFSKHLWQDPGTPGLARLAIGDADNDGELEILVGGDSKNVGLIKRSSTGEWSGEVIFTDIDKIRGCAIGDFDTRHEGNEVAVFGYSARISMLTQDESDSSKWNSRILFTDTGRGHDLGVGDFDPVHDGNELLVSGFSQKLTMVANYDDVTKPSFELRSADTAKSTAAGSTAVFNLSVETAGNFYDRIYLEVESLPAGVNIAGFASQSVMGAGKAQLTLSVLPTLSPGQISFSVKAHGGGSESSVSFDLSVTDKPEGLSVVSVDPDPDDHGANVHDLEIIVEFDSAIDTQSITNDTISIQDPDGNHYKGETELSDDGSTLTIKDIHDEEDDHKGLPYGSKITVKISTGITNTAGGTMESDYSWTFETGEEEEEPGEFGGLFYSVILVVIIIVVIVIIGVIFGRKEYPDEPEEEKKDDGKDDEKDKK